MLLSESEFVEYLQPLLLGHANPSQCGETVAQLVMSILCEPGDRVAGVFGRTLGYANLVSALVARDGWTRVVETADPAKLSELEETLNGRAGKYWDDAMERWLPRLSKHAFLDSLRWMTQQQASTGIRHWVVPLESDAYPFGFDDLADGRPHALWGSGNPSVLAQQSAVSIVGARVASRYGVEVATDLSVVAAVAEIVTVSGGAYGIDEAVHRGAAKLEAPTVAYMAGGLGNLYPRGNVELLRKVMHLGAVLSESAPEVVPAKWRFLMRNRLIAAHGAATVVVEAGKTSGALRTARLAIDLDRTVAVVPGPITSARSAGCHDLLNEHQSAVRLLARPQELPELIGLSGNSQPSLQGLGPLERRALDSFQSGSLEPWEVQRLAGFNHVELQIALGSLEMLGLIQRVGTRYLRATG